MRNFNKLSYFIKMSYNIFIGYPAITYSSGSVYFFIFHIFFSFLNGMIFINKRKLFEKDSLFLVYFFKNSYPTSDCNIGKFCFNKFHDLRRECAKGVFSREIFANLKSNLKEISCFGSYSFGLDDNDMWWKLFKGRRGVEHEVGFVFKKEIVNNIICFFVLFSIKKELMSDAA